ncbi:MAG: hypothetical protein B6244_14830, partial [Candidatus Cloacimonetes bacterium 4572_55]
TRSFDIIGTVSANVTEFSDQDVALSSEYCYRVRAYNTAGNSDLSNIACAVLFSNQPPVAYSGQYNSIEDNPFYLTLVGSDPEEDPLDYQIIAEPEHGTLTGSLPNLTYTPDADYFGADQLTFQVSDGQFDSDPADINIEIESINDPPTITLLGPDGDIANAFFLVQWQDQDVDDDATIRLYMDDDDNGLDGSRISPDLSEDQADNRWEWDASAVPEGVYYLYAEIIDNSGASDYSYGPGDIMIAHRHKGDLNGDSLITDADVAILVKFVTGKSQPNLIDAYVADVVEDGLIDIRDITRLVDMTIDAK